MFLLYYFIAAFLLAWGLGLILEYRSRQNKRPVGRQEFKKALRASRRHDAAADRCVLIIKP